MSNAITHHSRSIAKQTLLGVIAALALVAGASMALAADGDGTEEPATTCPETGDTTTTAVEDDAAAESDVEADVETDDECAPTSTTVAEDPESDEDDGDEGDDGESEETDEEDEADDGTDDADDAGEEVADETDGDDEFRNHGEAVSKAAREDCEPGPGHGACVSEVARSNAGKHGSEEGDDEVDDESDDDIDDSSESTESTRTEKPAKAAKGNGASKGKGHKG